MNIWWRTFISHLVLECVYRLWYWDTTSLNRSNVFTPANHFQYMLWNTVLLCFGLLWSNIYGFHTWWRHVMESLFALLASCEGKPPAISGFPSQNAMLLMPSFDMALILARTNSRCASDMKRHGETVIFTIFSKIASLVLRPTFNCVKASNSDGIGIGMKSYQNTTKHERCRKS